MIADTFVILELPVRNWPGGGKPLPERAGQNEIVISYPLWCLANKAMAHKRGLAATVGRGRRNTDDHIAFLFTSQELAIRFSKEHITMTDNVAVALPSRAMTLQFLNGIEREGCTHVGFDYFDGNSMAPLTIAEYRQQLAADEG